MKQLKNRLGTIHLIGVGGSGMSGIAEVLKNLGYEVSGSDLVKTDITERLESLGVTLFYSHEKRNMEKSSLVVISSAIDSQNIELLTAERLRIPIIKRAEMLSGLMNLKYGIAVAGTHGKTTTTSILASIFTEGNLDPTFIVGGKVNSYDSNAKLGQGNYLIVEADESDQSFLELQASSSIITNIEEDHLINYENNFNNLKNAFISFVKKLPFDGFVVACGDDKTLNKLIPNFPRTTICYGFQDHNDYVIKEHNNAKHLSYFSLHKNGQEVLLTGLNLLGVHNILNAAGAAVMALEEGVNNNCIKQALEKFQGVNRRMELKGELSIDKDLVPLIDDYGHHPSEINEIIKTVKKKWPHKNIVMIFQPHRFTRTRDMLKEFIHILSKVDTLLLMDIYSAGENEILGINSKNLAEEIIKKKINEVYYFKDNSSLFKVLPSLNLSNSVLVTQGAGNVGSLSDKLYKKYG